MLCGDKSSPVAAYTVSIGYQLWLQLAFGMLLCLFLRDWWGVPTYICIWNHKPLDKPHWLSKYMLVAFLGKGHAFLIFGCIQYVYEY